MGNAMARATTGELSLAATVARRHYLHGQNKTEIAADLGVSRFKVGRLLDLARSSGLVRISVADPGAVDVELGDRLRLHLGLDRAIVVNAIDGEPGGVRDHLAGLTASLLEETLTPTDVLGLAWSRSVLETAARVQRLPGCDVVQLSGALTWPDVAMNLVEAVQRLGRVGGGRSYAFYSPLFVSDPASVEVIHRQPEVAAAFARFGSVTTALVGIGSWSPASSTLHDTLTQEEREALRRNHVLADVSGTFLDDSGAPLPMPMTRQVVGISADGLRAIPRVIAIANGKEKAAAVRVAARAGYIKTLVTTSSLAYELLEMG
jgi:DNA-binding transcriptional regulator LsrR (DeoR family)